MGCSGSPRSPKSPYCEMHYGRLRRNGTLELLRTPTGTALASNGYRLVRVTGHPLAHLDGWAYEHRIVLYEKLNGQRAPCHWCGLMLSWDETYPESMTALVTDHLDGDKVNNDPDNLVPACNPCNMLRRAPTCP